jgi:hypothetical protein
VLIATSTHNIAEIRLRWALITKQSINQLQEVGNILIGLGLIYGV